MNLKIETIRRIYLFILVILFVLIVMAPYLIKEGISIFSEEILEIITLTILLVIGILIHTFYQRELDKRQKKLDEAITYIGSINVQIGQIRTIFDDIPKYPENKNDLKDIFKNLANRVLGIINADWVLFRIIEISSGRTLSEYSQARGKAVLMKYEISNQGLIAGKDFDDYTVIESDQKNLDIKVYCVVPIKQLSGDQEVLIKAIINDLEMFYLIFSSVYYRRYYLKKQK